MKNYKNNIEIIEYNDHLKEHIKTLNYEWLQKHFQIEEADKKALLNPKKEIIDKGGFIYYVKLDTEIIGTASLIKKTNTVFELAKMAVSDKHQGFGIGKLLLEYCLKKATEKNMSKLILYSNTYLKSAIHLYKKYDFIETELDSKLYKRANIKMEKII